MWQILDTKNLDDEISTLKGKALYEYLRLFIALLPKDQKIEMEVSKFYSWSDEEMNRFIATGEYPDWGLNRYN